MSSAIAPAPEDTSAGARPAAPAPMSRRGRVVLLVGLSLGMLITLRACTFLLGSILGILAGIGVPLVPLVAALAWMVPWITVASLRDVGSFRFNASWTVLLLLPVVALNWAFSFHFAFPVWSPWHVPARVEIGSRIIRSL